jgi:glycine reductase complex component B subunit gamma
MSQTLRVIHYINQFFGGLGGEEQAGVGVSFREGPVGPGLALKAALEAQAQVAGTIICGDNYFAAQPDEAVATVLMLIREQGGDVVVAGPAFNAGRYGMACGAVCEAAQERLGLPAFTALYPENPAVERYRRTIVIVPAGASAVGMRKAMAHVARLVNKVAAGGELGPAQAEGYLPHGIRRIELVERSAAERAVALLAAKLAGRPYETEVPLATYERIPPAPPLADIRHARIALVTEGGLVPLGNPDRIKHVGAANWAAYSIAGLDELKAGVYEGVHGGFDRTWVNEDPDRLVPLDIVRQLEQEGQIGSVHDEFYSTVGNGTPVANCQRFGREIAQRLLAANVQAALISGT